MRIISIDPGFERLGIAIIEKTNSGENLLYSDCFKTPKEIAFHERLLLLGNEIKRVVSEYKPQIMAIETLFFSSNQKTVMFVAEARGVVMYQASSLGLDIREYSPLQIKIATTGYGRADKNQVTQMVKQLIKVKNKKTTDDEFDAIAVGLTCFASLNSEKIRSIAK